VGCESFQYIIAYRSYIVQAIMTFKQWRKRLAATLGPVLVWWLIQLLWKTCRIERVIGQEHIDASLQAGQAFIPCYWHQQQIFCVRHLLNMAQRHPALKLGYLISPSADGDIATQMFGKQGVRIIRGSATRGGAQALREIYLAIKQESISPIVTPDGPTGPLYQCKPGVAMLAQLSKTPLLPMAYAGTRVWKLTSWDKFMLPVPFSRIVVAIGEPLDVRKSDAQDEFKEACERMNVRLMSTLQACEDAVRALR